MYPLRGLEGHFGGVSYFYQQEHEKNIQLQIQIDELNTRQRITEDKLSETKKLVTEFQLKLQEAKAKVEILINELTQEKTVRLEASNKLNQISADLEQQKVLRQDLEKRLNQSEADGKLIKDQMKIMAKEKMDLVDKIKNLESGVNDVELGKVVVNTDKTSVNQSTKWPAKATNNEPVKSEKKIESSAIKSLEGKIIVVNKEYNFAVINLGSKDKVSVGDEFVISRAGKLIGDLKVEKVHEAMSAAGFAVDLKDLIKENDLVTQKIK
ncbi:MAG: hypothetical protein NTX89_01775 [Candidatus Omnitrophica bacterium]|nr:hypothetical protein [Candidatus Omnitrophota bacterium]